jgi:uncharacterized protein YndB with AHSA1/START domain
MLKFVLLGLLLVIVVFVIVVSLRPSQFRVTRSATIAAPPEAVFPQINNLHNWEAWSPWAKMDPAAKNSYSGPPEGVGASFAWEGNSKVGAGSMTITDSQPAQLVRFRLDFLKPFKGTNIAEFTLQPDGGQTTVTWAMSGTNNFIGKAIGLFMDCEKMVGGSFEKGLADMKAIAEVKTAAK